MPVILHILTRPADPMVEAILAGQRNQPEAHVETVDLTRHQVDYEDLVARIFAADSVAVW
jgi:hypothetical protein